MTFIHCNHQTDLEGFHESNKIRFPRGFRSDLYVGLFKEEEKAKKRRYPGWSPCGCDFALIGSLGFGAVRRKPDLAGFVSKRCRFSREVGS